MAVLLTGGAGFIGSHLADRLVAKGLRTVVLDNLVLGREANLSQLAGHPQFRFVKGDILTPGLLDRLFGEESFKEVFHLAANSDIQKGGRDPKVDRDLTFATTFEILQAMRKHDVRRVTFTSSSAVYGERESLITEDSGPLEPVSMYGAAKLAGEAFISAFAHSYGLQAWIVRFPNVIGDRCTHGVIFDFVNKLRRDPSRLEVLGNGMQCKPYMYVGDLVSALLHIRDHAAGRFNAYNVGLRGLTTVRHIAQTVAEEMGLTPEIVYTGGERGWVGDVPRYEYDDRKLRELGWICPRTSDESVRMAVRKMLDSGGKA